MSCTTCNGSISVSAFPVVPFLPLYYVLQSLRGGARTGKGLPEFNLPNPVAVSFAVSSEAMSTHARSLLTDRACYTAITKIPTVQLMYSTTPLALSIAFQRNHVKFIFVAISALVVFSQPGIIYSHLPNPPPAQHFRFRTLRARNGSPAKAANIENLRILFNGS